MASHSSPSMSGKDTVFAFASMGRRWWRKIFIYPTFLGAVLGAIPTGIDLYKSVRYDIGFDDVQHAEEQRRLWIKNFDCAQNMSYQQVETGDGIKVQVGACTNGDVLIEVTDPRSKRILEWVSLDRLRSEASLAWLSPIGRAHAARALAQTKPSPRAEARMAQAGANVVCQVMKSETRIVRVVRQNGTCFREEIEVLKGKVVDRKQVACDTPCN